MALRAFPSLGYSINYHLQHCLLSLVSCNEFFFLFFYTNSNKNFNKKLFLIIITKLINDFIILMNFIRSIEIEIRNEFEFPIILMKLMNYLIILMNLMNYLIILMKLMNKFDDSNEFNELFDYFNEINE